MANRDFTADAWDHEAAVADLEKVIKILTWLFLAASALEQLEADHG